MTQRLLNRILITFGVILIYLGVNSLSHSSSKTNSIDSAKLQVKSVKSGDTLESILKKIGFKLSQIAGVVKNNSFTKDFNLYPGMKYFVMKEKDNPNIKEVRLYLPRSPFAYVFRSESSTGFAERVFPEFEKRKVSIEGKVIGSILSSIQKKISNKWVAYRFTDAYSLNFNLRKELKRNAKFKLTVEELYEFGTRVHFGEILETELEIDGKMVKRTYVPFDEGGAFIGKDILQDVRTFYAPLEYLRISSPFNPRRIHPVRKRRIPHWGVDLEMQRNANVYAAQDGKVKRFGKNRVGGRYVVLEHIGGYITMYDHLEYIGSNITVGKEVKAGEMIAKVGCSGLCTRPHLHFAIKKGRRYLDPMKHIYPYPYHHKNTVMAFK